MIISTFAGGGDMKTTTDTPLRPAEQTYPASGVTGTGYGTYLFPFFFQRCPFT